MRKSNFKSILMMIIGIIIGVIAAAVVVRFLPATFFAYKRLIFFVVLLVVAGSISLIAGKVSGK